MRLPLRKSLTVLLAGFALALSAASAAAALPVPPNDNFANAEQFADGRNGNRDIHLYAAATRELGEPMVAGAPTEHTTWFRRRPRNSRAR